MDSPLPLPVYAEEDLDRLGPAALIELVIRDEDRVPYNVIAACARLGEPMIEELRRAIDEGQAWNGGSAGEWWLMLHAAMILGRIPSEPAGLLLVRLMRRMATEDDDSLQDWLAGDWPALFANKPRPAIDAARALAEDRALDWYARAQGVEITVDAARRESEPALEGSLDRLAASAADESEDWEFRTTVANTLLDFPRERHRALMRTIADREAELAAGIPFGGVSFAPDDIDEAFAKGCDAPDWMRRGDPWRFYSPATIAARQKRWAEEDARGAKKQVEQPPVTQIRIPYVRDTPKTGRNDPCPCSSGKKYKKCCLGQEQA